MEKLSASVFCLMSGIAVCGQAMGGLSAKSYIKEGLIAHWDGEFNAGYSAAHNPSATTWTELTGHGPNIGVPTTGTAAFSEKALDVQREYGSPTGGNSQKQYAAPAILQAFSNAQFSAEVAFNKSEANTARCHFFIYGNDGFWIGTYDDNQAGWIANGANGRDDGRTSGITDPVTVETTLGGHTLSCSQNGKKTVVRFDEQDPVTGSYTLRATPNLAHGFRFNRGWAENLGMTGSYYSMRVYDRPLLADEAQVNRAIDRVRFFGAKTSDVPLPAGYRWQEGTEVSLERQFSATVARSEGGTVSVGGASASTSVPLWVEHNGSSSASLTAIPAAGYRFVRWNGVSSEADARLATVTTVVTGDVSAVFLKIDGKKLGAQSYVTSGLIAQWDGVENAGAGVHRDQLTNWKDLVGSADIALPSGAEVAGADSLRTTRAAGTLVGGMKQAPSAVPVFNAVTTAHYTVEISYNKTQETTVKSEGFNSYHCVLMSFFNSTYWVGTDYNAAGDTEFFGISPVGYGYEKSLRTYVTKPKACGEHVLSCSQDGTAVTVRLDGDRQASATLSSATPVSDCHGLTFNKGYYSNQGLDGLYHSIRFYNRALTADEAMINRAVDQVRFFYADPASYDLPAGWRFDLSDGVSLQHTNVVSVAEGEGTVSVGGGEAGTAVEIWVEQGGTAAIAVNAVPANGYHFKRWQGNVVSGDVKSRTGTLVVSGDVQAVFKPDSGLVISVR